MSLFNRGETAVFALGGLGEVGKNMYCIEQADSLIIIDTGVMFPENDLPGIDYVIPNYDHLVKNQYKIKALLITHGHEDHIGGIHFLLQKVHIPIIYAPRLAAALIRHKLEENRVRQKVNIIEIDGDSTLTVIVASTAKETKVVVGICTRVVTCCTIVDAQREGIQPRYVFQEVFLLDVPFQCC